MLQCDNQKNVKSEKFRYLGYWSLCMKYICVDIILWISIDYDVQAQINRRSLVRSATAKYITDSRGWYTRASFNRFFCRPRNLSKCFIISVHRIRSLGHPRKSWLDVMIQDMRANVLNIKDAEDRTKWKRLIRKSLAKKYHIEVEYLDINDLDKQTNGRQRNPIMAIFYLLRHETPKNRKKNSK